MKTISILFLLFFGITINAQSWDKETVKTFQKELNDEYLNKETTPLRGENFLKFKKHPFFSINEKYKIVAKFVKTENATPLEFPTSSGKTKYYTEYGKAYFTIDGKSQSLTLYTSESLKSNEGYEDYLFLPFRDTTNGKQTYGGGRYLDLKVPTTSQILIDFNKAYQPYCAYNAVDYSCPIVPETNQLKIPIKAGVKYDDVYH